MQPLMGALTAGLVKVPGQMLATTLAATARRAISSSALARAEPPRPPLPPFTLETARQKVQMAEDAWNSCDPDKVAMAYTPDSKWRNRSELFEGRDAIRAFLTRKWQKELGYRLKKYLWSYSDSRIAIRFEYEWHDGKGNWTRSYGCELCARRIRRRSDAQQGHRLQQQICWQHGEFAPDGRMAERHASINDAQVKASELRIAKPTS